MNASARLQLCLLACVAFAPQAAQAQFQSLVSRIPGDVNVMMFVDVEKLQASELAKREGWADRHERMFEAGLLVIPPKCTRFVSGVKFDLDTMTTTKHLSLMNLTYDPSIADVAVRYHGTVDTIQDRQVAVLPGDIYVVRLMPDLVATGYPATRQDVVRWMNRIYGTVPITHYPYLVEAQKYAEQGSPLLFALELQGAYSPSLIRDRLEGFKAIEGKEIDLDAASEALASIRGVTLGVAVSDKRGGAIKVDFDKDITVIKDIAKPLLLEVLARNGASISEFYDWEVSVTEKQIQMRGELFQSGARRIMSLLEPPPGMQKYSSGQEDDAQTQEQKVLAASQLYFKSIVSLVDDLRDKKQTRQTMGQLSVWFDRYARRIDRMSVLNVDPDLQGYGKYVADTFRGGSSSVTQAAADSRIEQSQVPEQYDVRTWSTPIGVTGGGYWGGAQAWGWGGWQATPDNLRRGRMQSQIRTKQTIKGSLSANNVLQEIDEVTSDMRRAMTNKYKADF